MVRSLCFGEKTGGKSIINETNFAHMCVCLQETEHPQQVCSNETGDITAKEKSKCTCTHINSTPFLKSPVARLLNHNCISSPQPSVHSWPQGKAAFSLILFNEKAPVGFISISSGL